SIGPRLAKEAVAAYLNDELVDLSRPIEKSSSLRLITTKDQESVEILRHSTAHVLAEAVIASFPEAKPTIGPVVDEGFYYDFDHPPFNPDDLEKIEKKMQEIIKKDEPFERLELTKKQALDLFKDNRFKTEMIEELDEGTISAYKQGDFIDLCRGPHLPTTGMIGAFKLTKIAGAYWRGDAKNKQLQRIYGISFFTSKELNQYNTLMEEAAKRDHRKIGKDLDLYSFHEEAPGMPFWHPKGMVLYNELTDLARQENTKRGYEEIMTPTILNSSLWKLSGHWDNFKDNMYFTNIDNQEYAVKPMNCPGGILIYKTGIHSYRELPLRRAEFGYVHRHELSGVLSGLFRVRAFTQDDAHSFCTEEQVEDEIIDMVEYAVKLYSLFGFKDIGTFIATRPEKSIGTDEAWDIATNALTNALKKKGMEYHIKEGEGAFYGPKIEFNIKDAIGRNWQCGTIQVDFSMPKRFDATYEAKDGTKKTPVMIHRAILGSLERFIGIIVEHYAGKFPLWISPVQAIILPIADRHKKYCEEVKKKLLDAGMRVETDLRAESTSKKVRDAQLQQINYILVIGDNEEKAGTVNVRTRDNKVHGEKKIDDFLKELLNEIESRK
ncbi:threonine--tRNA ligase, partial [Candidatus Woesearchaeota archaeon]|nr:threonine--tRNA ligase [Candidatus Woesearchaeota archaeon]